MSTATHKTKAAASPGQKNQCKYIAPPAEWKKKVVKGQGWDVKVIQKRAADAAGRMIADYLSHASSQLAIIEEAMVVAKSAPQADRDEALDVVRRVAHEMRGEAGCLGYALISHIGTSLCDYIEGVTELDAVQLKAIAIHADAMRVVITENISGDGGDGGKALLAGIDSLVSKTLHTEPSSPIG